MLTFEFILGNINTSLLNNQMAQIVKILSCGRQDALIQQSQYHGYWSSSIVSSQGISSYGTDKFSQNIPV